MKLSFEEWKDQRTEAEALADGPAKTKAITRLNSAEVYEMKDDKEVAIDIKTIIETKTVATDPSPIVKCMADEITKAIKAAFPAGRPADVDIRVKTDPVIESKMYKPVRSFTGTEEQKKLKAYRFGVWMLGSVFGMQKYADKATELGATITKAQSEGTNTAGSYLVPEVLLADLIDLREQYGVFRKYAKVIGMTRDNLSVPRRVSGLTTYWPGEAGSITESSKGWDIVTLIAKKLGCLAKYSTELLEDAIINVGDDLANEIVYAFSKTEDDCGFIGTGTSTYGGIVGVCQAITTKWTSTTTTAAGSVIASGNLMSEVVHSDLCNVVANLPQYAAGNPRWYTSRYGWATIFGRLSTNVASGMGTRREDLIQELPKTYLGYEIVVTQAMPKTDTNSQIVAFFGELEKAATFGDRREVQIAVSDQRYFENDQVGIRGTERFDIVVHDVGDGTSAGPVVGLRAAAS